MRLLLIAALLLLFVPASFSISLIQATTGDFEFLYSEEALRFKPDHPEVAIVRTIHQNNLISMRIQELMLSRVRLLGVSGSGMFDEHQKEQTLYFTRWILQEYRGFSFLSRVIRNAHQMGFRYEHNSPFMDHCRSR